jgi:MYXO-CTERM domain-containing protein
LVRDSTGAVSNSADREACVDTTPPPFFRGCSVASEGGDPIRPAAVGGVLVVVFFFGRARRGPRRS